MEAYQRLNAQQRRLATAEDQLATLTDRADREEMFSGPCEGSP